LETALARRVSCCARHRWITRVWGGNCACVSRRRPRRCHQLRCFKSKKAQAVTRDIEIKGVRTAMRSYHHGFHGPQ
jgi:hypothetical protein